MIIIIKANYHKICSRVRENDFYDTDTFSNMTLFSFPSYLDVQSKERVDVFLCKRTSVCCSLCNRDLVRMYLQCFGKNVFELYIAVFFRIHIKY